MIDWKNIGSSWYYFHAIEGAPTWEIDPETGNWRYNAQSKNKPFGSMYQNEMTPDGYYVNSDGAWDGKEK